MRAFLLLLTTLLLLPFSANLVAQKEPKIKHQYTLGIATQREPNDPFWGVVEDIMEAACNDLGMKLIRYHAHSNQRLMIETVDRAVKDKVDILVFPNLKEAAPAMLERSHAQQLPVYLFNANINPGNREKTGIPREKYPYWLGRLMSDERQAGALLAEVLIENAYRKNISSPDEPLEIIALTGTLVETPAIDRAEGMKQAAARYKNVTMNQVVHAFWDPEQAYSKTKRLFKRYPKSQIVWSASDEMALGSARAIRERGKEPGEHILTGGIDWTTEGIKQTQAGVFEASIGGHVADAAWVAVMLYDYLHGMDFAEEGVDRRQPMMAFPLEHADTYLQQLDGGDWDNIDFRQFSKVLNPAIKTYQFDASVLFSGQ